MTYDYNAQKLSKLNEDENCVQKNRDGSYTEGKKKNGIWEGPFKKTYKDGSYYKGTFINGEIRGEVTYISIDG